jgi:squalene-hopene/tetraprenyl-beta-curcumene cyclase
VLLRHYLAEPVDAGIEAKIAAYLRRIQGARRLASVQTATST